MHTVHVHLLYHSFATSLTPNLLRTDAGRMPGPSLGSPTRDSPAPAPHCEAQLGRMPWPRFGVRCTEALVMEVRYFFASQKNLLLQQ